MFRYFRRHAKVYIIVAGVILMFVFTIGDSLTRFMGQDPAGSGGRSPTEVAVSWNGGKLTGQELGFLMSRRQLLDQFVFNVMRSAYIAADEQGLADLPPPVQPVGLARDLQSNTMWSEQRLEAEVVQTYILAEKARELGVKISNEVIKDYISQLGRGLLGKEAIAEITRSVAPGRRGSPIEIIFDGLREQLLAHAYLSSQTGLLAAEMPVNRWLEWRRANDQMVVEAAAIDPRDLLIDVPEPTEQQLREYYEEHKLRLPFPVRVAGVEMPSPQPGFRIPRRVAVQYLRANYNEFVDRYAEEVTDEEIEAYYEANKYLFSAAPDFGDFDLGDLPSFDEPAEQEGVEAAEMEGETTEQAAPPSEPAAEEQPAETEPSDDSEPAAEGEEPAEAEGAATEEMAEDSEDSAESEEPAESPAAADTDDSPEAPAVEESAADEAEASDESDSEESVEESAEEESTTDDAAEEEREGDGAAARVASPFRLAAYQIEGDPAADEPAPDTAATEAETTPAAESTGDDAEGEFQPLEEVADEIRRRIAEDRFFSEIEQVLDEIALRLNREFAGYFQQRLDAEDRGEKPPAPSDALVDLTPYAQEFNLEYEQTEPLNQVELADSEIGRSIEMRKYTAPVWQVLLATDVDLYEPMQSADIGGVGDRYLLMKISDEPARTPKFEEIRNEVARAWKQAEAAKLALKKAEDLAEQVRRADLPLADFFEDDADVEVTRTAPFTYITAGDVAPLNERPNYRLSQPEGLVHPGPEFMDQIFLLGEGDVAAVLNFDHSKAYVVRLAEEVETEEELRRAFQSQVNFWPGRSEFLIANTQQLQQAVIGDMLDSLDVEWHDTAQEDEEAPADEDAE